MCEPKVEKKSLLAYSNRYNYPCDLQIKNLKINNKKKKDKYRRRSLPSFGIFLGIFSSRI